MKCLDFISRQKKITTHVLTLTTVVGHGFVGSVTDGRSWGCRGCWGRGAEKGMIIRNFLTPGILFHLKFYIKILEEKLHRWPK